MTEETSQRFWKAVPDGSDQLPSCPRAQFPTRFCITTDDTSLDESPSDYDKFDDLDDLQIVYQDRYVKISQKNVIIKRYFFPDAVQKRLPLESIKKIKLLNANAIVPKWGIDLDRMAWWAHDHQRDPHLIRENVVYVMFETSDRLNKGVTVKNIDNFLNFFSNTKLEIEY